MIQELHDRLIKIPYVFNVEITESSVHGKELYDIRISMWFDYKTRRSDVAHHDCRSHTVEEIEFRSEEIIDYISRETMYMYWEWASEFQQSQ